ncbi:DUF6747 family protein [Zeaxanthinibacter enoshimensis]|uniref:Uncharacterized protein n=1 Tax=Zeaxanthinibacter enoshimensis TaxID=392009 RepID=A0A4R6TV37_9FLAO|nr:DUF6747 family protein [Zeaxanthinibacter enoshimensis]TDQ32798.1 hypothetical protein CLV82_0631 [Zeaxanthinibacter enoshimensis]
MKQFAFLKELYLSAFRDIGNFLVRNYFKLFSWFCFMLFAIVLYAFVYRLLTGYAF